MSDTNILPTRIGTYSFTDATGVPLDGSVLVLVDSEKATIYDSDGTQIQNPAPMTNGCVDIYMDYDSDEQATAYVLDEDGATVRTIPNIKLPSVP